MDLQWYIERRLVHEIHTSERGSFRGCRRRWNWIFNENYYPKMTPKHFDFGTAFHKALETYYNPATWSWPSDVRMELAIKAFRGKNHDQKNKHLEANNLTFLDDEVETDFQERQDLGIGMLRYFQQNVAPKYDSHWKPIRVEVEFMVPIPNPERDNGQFKDFLWCDCDRCAMAWVKSQPGYDPKYPFGRNNSWRTGWRGLPVVYAGRIDALGEDENGDLWIIDWKTAKTIRDDHTFLELDDQVGSYPWALWRLGIPVRGFIYHEQRKGFPQPPKENKYRRLGCLFSVSKNQDVSYDTYLAHIREFDTQAYEDGYYDEYLEYLKNEGITYFERNQIHKSTEQLLEVEYNIGLEALEMINPRIRVYPSPGRFSCDNCAFQQPCIEKSRGGDYKYGLDTLFEKREAYYLRTEPSTDKKSAE
jgi:hypothetical protein